MRTSEEIYNRIRWDARLDPARFVIGIDVHAQRPKLIPLAAFVPGGDYPWHRVIFFEADGERVWDRHAGIDRLDTTEAGRVRAPQRLRAPFFSARTPYRWSALTSRWVEAATPAPEFAQGASTHLRALTWNTLWDRYDSERIHTARRRPLLIDALRACDADVIALQEVEPPLLEALLQSEWVRERYALSDSPEGRDAERYGVLLLSRLPVLEAAIHAFGPYKAAVAITVALPDRALVVLTTHLTSDHSDPRRREFELDALRGGIDPIEGDVLVLGDFNDGGPTPAAKLAMVDAWSAVRGATDDTPTFDPTVNPLAAVSSLSGRASRLDRVFLRGADLAPTDASLVGTEPTPDGLYLSDHYGVGVSLSVGARVGEGLDVQPTARTALAFVPPESVWPAIQRIRKEHDPSFDRWPPHVNLVFGFVPESSFDAALPLVASAAREVSAFRAVLEGTHAFHHAADSTVWLDPAADGRAPWQRLREALVRRFPRCAGRAEGFTPHLSLGKVTDPVKVLAAWAAGLGRHEVEVGELVLLARRGDEPMEPRAYVSLGTGAVRVPDRASAATVNRAGVRADRAETVVRRIAAALPEGRVHITGSRRIGCALPDADLDLVIALPGPLDLDGIEARVRAEFAEAESLRRVHAVRVPGIELRVLGLDVDLTVVDAGSVPPDEALDRRMELGDAAAIALSAVSDADAVLAAATAGDASDSSRRREAFLALARTVKAWARAKGLDAAPFGGLPGIAWLVLCARTVDPALSAVAQLDRFFGTWAAWDWREPVALEPAMVPFGSTDDPVRIATPTAPVRSCTSAVSRASAATLTEELYAAWELVSAARAEGRDPMPALLASPELHRQHAAFAVVTVEATSAGELATMVGWARGRMRALLTLLEEGGVERVRAFPRPFDATATRVRYAVGLGPRPPSAEALAKLTATWEAGRASVAWVEGGGVPTLR